MEIKVSIIVPVYNAELFIERCIKSIREQTYTNIEIILVNDGSTDNSESILMDLAQTDPRIVDVKQKNQGVSAARNTGMQRAQGDYILFIDSDDWIEKDMVASLLQPLTEKAYDFVFCDYYLVTDKAKERIHLFKGAETEIAINTVKKASITTDCINSAWLALYKREIIEANRLIFDTALTSGEDNVFNMAYLDQCGSSYYCKKALYYYEVHTGSGCRKVRPDQIKMYFLQLSYKLKYVEKWGYGHAEIDLQLYQLMLTHLSAFIYMEENKNNVCRFLKEVYSNAIWQQFKKSKGRPAFRELPKTYVPIAFCIHCERIGLTYTCTKVIKLIRGHA